MEPKFKTSFIPKKSLEADVSGTTPGRYVNRRSVSGPGFYLTLFIFLMSLAVAVGVFGYTEVTSKRIEEKRDRLIEVRAAFRPEQIVELSRADMRLENVKKLLGDHIAVTELFDLLEEITLKKVRYTNLTFAAAQTSARGAVGASSVNLEGLGATMKDVAQQVNQFDTNKYLNSPTVTNLARENNKDDDDDTEITDFTVNVNIDPQLTSYATALSDKRRQVDATPSQPAEVADEPAATTTPAVE